MHCSSTERAAAGAEPERPDVFVVLAGEVACAAGLDDCRRSSRQAPRFGRGVGLAEDVAGADDGVLNVGAGLALEAERIFEVEGDDGVARELEHEVAQSADGDLLGDLLALGLVAAGLARVDFGARGGDELVDQVVGLDAEALAAADFDVGACVWSSSETS